MAGIGRGSRLEYTMQHVQTRSAGAIRKRVKDAGSRIVLGWQARDERRGSRLDRLVFERARVELQQREQHARSFLRASVRRKRQELVPKLALVTSIERIARSRCPRVGDIRWARRER